MRIAFLVQLPKRVSPGQRFRIEQYEASLEKKGFSIETFSFLDEETYRILYQPGHLWQKSVGVLKGFLRRIAFLFKAGKYDFIFLQREAAPVGPPVFEWILAKLLRKKLVLDFDDAIWIRDKSGTNGFVSLAKCYWKIKYLCRWSYKVSVGNQYLVNFAADFNKNVVLIPTSVDVEKRYNKLKQHQDKPPVIGWTGSHSTVKYLHSILPVLKQLESKMDFEFLVICDQRPGFELAAMRFLPWNEHTEIDDLLQIDIGIMPLVQDAWSEGKCGFKLIQYLALGIPAVTNPVGVNKIIVENGKNGYLCETLEEWQQALTSLAADKSARAEMGAYGRKKIEAIFSVQANDDSFSNLFS